MEKNPRKIILNGMKNKEVNEKTFFMADNTFRKSSKIRKHKKFYTYLEKSMISNVYDRDFITNNSISILRDNKKHTKISVESNDMFCSSIDLKNNRNINDLEGDNQSKWKIVKNFLKGIENLYTFSTRNIDEVIYNLNRI